MLASLPSPRSGLVSLGPFDLHAYGLAIALAAIAAVWLSNRRWIARGGQPDDMTTIAVWSLPVGILGARIYHVATDWAVYRNDPLDALRFWDGGLGIWGGIAAGVGMGLLVARRRQLPLLAVLDVVAPALALAQAIGRWGNWFNQELFGRPTTLPWALEIDAANRPAGYETAATFHPAFLYESLTCLGICAVLVLCERFKTRLRTGQLFALYVMIYALGRRFIEALRIDEVTMVGGLRLNEWTAMIVLAVATVAFFSLARRPPADPRVAS